MKIDLDEIKRVVKEGKLKEVSQETGIPLRTLEDWRYENNKWLKQTEERLTALQKYINNLEENKMDKIRKRLSPDLLYGTYSNYDDTVNLEFHLEDYVVYVCRVKVTDLNDEFYFDNAETVQKAIDEVEDEDIEVYKDGEEILYEDEIELN